MAEDKQSPEKATMDGQPVYIPSQEEIVVRNKVLQDFIVGRNVIQKSYNQFNGESLYDVIDDWTKRWNGYIPPASVLIDRDQSRIFLNFTRNQVIRYLSKMAMQRPKIKIKAVNKKTSMIDQHFSDLLVDLNTFSLDAENGDLRFLEASLECTVKGTAVVYEGYKKEEQKLDVPIKFDAVTGKVQTQEEKVTIYDDCYQQLVPLEDFYIANPYQPDVQKQPFVMWRQITTYEEAIGEFSKYGNWKYVKAGGYTVEGDPTTFYRNKVITDLAANQVEIIRYYQRRNAKTKKTKHVIVINGVVMFDGPIPFKNGKYPFAKSIFEPYEVPFFWGMGFPNKIMGEQDLQNTFINMMADKTFGSLLPYGLSSDLDDLIEDDVLQPNKIRKVGDINKWRFDTLPGISAGEQSMFQLIMNLARENSGDLSGGAQATTPHGGVVSARQALQKQQESMQQIGFSAGLMEDYERDRTELRIAHIMQFYSIPKIEKISGKEADEIQQLVYRDVRLDNVSLENGKQGTKIIKVMGEVTNPDQRAKMEDHLSVLETMGEETGVPTEAWAIQVNTFNDYNFSVQIVNNSSYERNQVLDQAVRHEYADWRMRVQQEMGVPVNMKELIKWVDEAYDIDTERFAQEPQPQPGMNPMDAMQGQQGQQLGQPAQQGVPAPAEQMASSKSMPNLSEIA